MVTTAEESITFKLPRELAGAVGLIWQSTRSLGPEQVGALLGAFMMWANWLRSKGIAEGVENSNYCRFETQRKAASSSQSMKAA